MNCKKSLAEMQTVTGLESRSFFRSWRVLQELKPSKIPRFNPSSPFDAPAVPVVPPRRVAVSM